MSSTGHKVADVTIVSGLGLAQFHDDTFLGEPNAASTAGHKTTRQDLLEKKCSEFMANINLQGSSTAGCGAMLPPQKAPCRRLPAQQSGGQLEAPGPTNTPLKSFDEAKSQHSQDTNQWVSHGSSNAIEESFLQLKSKDEISRAAAGQATPSQHSQASNNASVQYRHGDAPHCVPRIIPEKATNGSIDSTCDAGRQEAWEDYMKPPFSSAHSTESSCNNRPDQRYQNPDDQPRPSPAPERGFHNKHPPSSDCLASAPVRKEEVGVRTRRDGGSLAEACDENKTVGSSTLKSGNLCPSSSKSENHQHLSINSALKAQLGGSSSVNVSSNKKQTALNQISAYGSLVRAAKAVPTNAAKASASNLYHSKSQTDVSGSSDWYQATPAMSAREFLNIKKAITELSDNSTVVNDSARDAATSQQDFTTLHDASVNIEMLLRQKELIKQRISRHLSLNVHLPGQSAAEENATEKRSLQESKYTPSSGKVFHDEAVGNSQQNSHYHLGQVQIGGTDCFLKPIPPNQPQSASKTQLENFVPHRDTHEELPRERRQQPPHSSNVTHSRWRTHDRSPNQSWEESGERWNDTVRLEPSVTLSSSFSETLKPEYDTHCTELEDAIGLSTLSVSECGPSAADMMCYNPPVVPQVTIGDSFLAPEEQFKEKNATNADKKTESASNELASEPKDKKFESSCKSDVPSRPVTTQPNHMEASRSLLVFGCVDRGTTVTQKLSFNNRDNADMTLSLSIIGSSSFTVVEPEKASSVVLPASGIVTLTIGFSPAENDSAHSAVLECKPRGQLGNIFKYKIQLQGYGGCGALKPADQEVCVPFAAPGCPAIVRVGLVNTGLRAVCLNIRSFSDEECSVLLYSKDCFGSFMVQPDELVMRAGESQDVLVVATALGKSAKTSLTRDGSGRELLATLLITYCEELLRRRHRRRLASGCSKATAASRESPIDWDTGIRGENLAATAEEDSLPSQAEDAKVFIASCRQIKVPVYTSFRTASLDASVTCFFPLIPDITLSDTTLAGDDNTHSRNMLSRCGGREGNDLNKPATQSVADASGRIFLFNVEEERDPIIAKRMMPPPPPPKSASGSDRSVNKCTTTNSTKRQGSSCSSNDGSSKRVLDNALRDSVAVVAAADNEDNREQIKEIKDCNYSPLPEKDYSSSKRDNSGLTSTPVVGVAETPCIEVFPKQLSLKPGGTAAIVAVNKTKREQTLQVVSSEPCLNTEPRVASVDPHGSISVQLSLKPDLRLPNALLLKVLCNGQENLVQVCVQQAEVQKILDTATAGRLYSSGLEISPMALSFPITAVGKKSFVKLSLKSLSTSVKQVVPSVTPGGAFVVKKQPFQIEVGHYVNLLVEYKPRAAGEHRDRLQLLVGREALVEVTLSGSCV